MKAQKKPDVIDANLQPTPQLLHAVETHYAKEVLEQCSTHIDTASLIDNMKNAWERAVSTAPSNKKRKTYSKISLFCGKRALALAAQTIGAGNNPWTQSHDSQVKLKNLVEALVDRPLAFPYRNEFHRLTEELLSHAERNLSEEARFEVLTTHVAFLLHQNKEKLAREAIQKYAPASATANEKILLEQTVLAAAERRLHRPEGEEKRLKAGIVAASSRYLEQPGANDPKVSEEFLSLFRQLTTLALNRNNPQDAYEYWFDYHKRLDVLQQLSETDPQKRAESASEPTSQKERHASARAWVKLGQQIRDRGSLVATNSAFEFALRPLSIAPKDQILALEICEQAIQTLIRLDPSTQSAQPSKDEINFAKPYLDEMIRLKSDPIFKSDPKFLKSVEQNFPEAKLEKYRKILGVQKKKD